MLKTLFGRKNRPFGPIYFITTPLVSSIIFVRPSLLENCLLTLIRVGKNFSQDKKYLYYYVAHVMRLEEGCFNLLPKWWMIYHLLHTVWTVLTYGTNCKNIRFEQRE